MKLGRISFCLYFYKTLEKGFKVIKTSKILMFEGDWLSYLQKFVSADNSVQNICQKVKDSRKFRQNQKMLLSVFVFVLTAIAKI